MYRWGKTRQVDGQPGMPAGPREQKEELNDIVI